MGQDNTVPRRINGVEGAAGQVMLSGGPGVLETWGAPAPAAHVHAAGDVTSGQFPLARMPRAAADNFLEGNGVGADPIFNALIAGDIPNLAAAKITSGQFPLARMPRGTLGHVITGTGAGTSPSYQAPAAGGAEVASGGYTGNNTNDRQITTGFKCSMVIITEYSTNRGQWILIPDQVVAHGDASVYHSFGQVGNTYLHGTDGFVVDNTAVAVCSGRSSNDQDYLYKWWAISE